MKNLIVLLNRLIIHTKIFLKCIISERYYIQKYKFYDNDNNKNINTKIVVDNILSLCTSCCIMYCYR